MSNDCATKGHRWVDKTDGKGQTLKVCIACGTDERREAIMVLRWFQRTCRENKPTGQWPNEIVCKAIDTVLGPDAAMLAAAPSPEPR